MTKRNEDSYYGSQAIAEYTADALNHASTTEGGEKIFRLNLARKGFDTLITLYEIRTDDEYPDDIKDALSVMVIAGLFGGYTPAADLPLTFQQAWDYINNIPNVYDGGSKEEFWEKLNERFGDDLFPLNLDGTLSPPDFLGSPPIQPDFSPLDTLPNQPHPSQPVVDGVEPFVDAPAESTPLVIDLDNDGVELTQFNAEDTATFFDIDHDGFAEQTAWVAPDDGLLALDRNANGRIDDAGELFGTATIDGFAVLQALDTNGDLRIDAADADFANLLIWNDANGDALSQTSELNSLSYYNIVSIDLAGITPSTSSVNGNAISHTSTVTFANASTAVIADAWFVHDNLNSYYVGEYELNVDALLLPALRGYGELPDLHIAMSRDATLLGLVDDFTTEWTFASWQDPAALDAAVKDILYLWAGVDGVSPTSRGPNVDAQHLEFLEKFDGTPFLQQGVNPDPYERAGALIELSWHLIFSTLKAQLLIQAGADGLFSGYVSFNPWSGAFEGELPLSEDAIEDLVPLATAGGVDAEAFWAEVGRFLSATKGLDNLTTQEDGWLDDAIQASNPALTWMDIKDLVNEQPVDWTVYGTSASETLNGTGGNDTIYAYEGNDTINSGAGGDMVIGGTGNDVYVFGGGNDLYSDSSGTDRIDFASGISLNGLSFERVEVDELLIRIGANSSIQITDYFGGGSANTIQTLKFYDNSTFDLTTLSDIITHGTQGDDGISGVTGWDDIIYGYGGDDNINGYDGEDIIDGGAGNDLLNGNYGSDTYIASAGFDIIYEDASSADTNVIVIPAAYDASDVVLVRGADLTNLNILISGLGQIRFDSYFHWSSAPLTTEIQFANGVDATITIDTQQIQTIGTAGNDYLTGIDTNASQNDILNGKEGDDTLDGGAGDDLFIYESGLDWIYEYSGTDTLRLTGSTTINDISFTTGLGNATIVINSGVNEIALVGLTSGTPDMYVDFIEFADGFRTTLPNFASWTWGTSSANTITGTSAADTIIGKGGNDTLSGGNGDDAIHGGTGNDTVEGGVGNDLLHGGDGTDTLTYANATAAVTISLALTTAQITGGAGTDTVFAFENLTGSAYNDVLTGNAGANTINGGNGNDTIQGGDGNDTLNGGSGTDRVTYAAAAAGVTVNLATTSAQNTGGAGTDTLSSFENLTGSAFADILTGTSSANSIDGGGGDDVIDGGAGNDTLIGGSGTDRLTYASATAGITINLATTTGQATGGSGTDTISGFEHLTGSAYNDVLTGNSSANLIDGGAGDDTIDGAGGTDTLTYANASSGVTVNLATTTAQNTGGAGTDTISNFENLTGSGFNDTLTGTSGSNVIEGGAGNDTMNGSGGTDTLTYANAAAGITLSLAVTTGQSTGGAGTDTVSNFENLTGSAFDDTLTGNSSANVISGGDGNDAIQGGGGNDTLTGGAGTDTLTYAAAGSGITVSLAVATGQVTGGAGTDTVSGFENLTGSAYGDTLTGDGNANVIQGGAGADTISAGGGNDTIYGGDGLDTLYGQSGADAFILQATSAFNNVDVVKDFTAGTGGDALDLTDLLAAYDPLTEDIADFISLTTSGGNTFVAVDRDGTGGTYIAQDVAKIEGVTGLSLAGLLADGNLVVPV